MRVVKSLCLLVMFSVFSTAFGQLGALSERPLYDLKVTLNPQQMRSEGTLLVKWVNPTDDDLYNIAFIFENPNERETLINRVRVNRRSAEVVYKFESRGDDYTGFELVSKRRMPPGVVSEIEIGFRSEVADTLFGLILYHGIWFPQVLGVPGSDLHMHLDQPLRSDVDATVSFPLEYRAAMSGRVIRQDGNEDGAEFLNVAENVSDFGVVLKRGLIKLENEVYGISLNVFHTPENERWGSRIAGDVRSVLEYYKRSTPYAPPLNLSVLPGENGEKANAFPLFSNAIIIKGDINPGSEESKMKIAEAITALYWDFQNKDECSALEKAIVQYGKLLYCRSKNIDDSWLTNLVDLYTAGLLLDNKPSLVNTISEIELDLISDVNRALIALLVIENHIGKDVMYSVYNSLFEKAGGGPVSLVDLKDSVENISNINMTQFIDHWFIGEGYFDDRIVSSVCSQDDSGRYITDINIERNGISAFSLPVRMIHPDFSQTEMVLPAGAKRLTFETDKAPGRVVLDPEHTTFQLSEVFSKAEVGVLAANILLEYGQFSDAKDILRDFNFDNGLEVNAEFDFILAQAEMNLGNYLEARDILTNSLLGLRVGEDITRRHSLLLANVLDLMGMRNEAVVTYRELSRVNDSIGDDAKHYIEVPFTQ
jgi:tetratricopeptide (TPR) repeat protein